MRRLLRRTLRKVGQRLVGLADGPPPPQELRVRPWRAADGDRTLRLDYDLDAGSTVLDLGGYQGQWASDIFARYGCTIHVFEPVPAYAAAIRRRFARNPRIHVHECGLAAAAGRATIHLHDDATSTFAKDGAAVDIRFERAADFLAARSIDRVHLLKVNIEGGEYDLLDHLLDSGLIDRVDDLQVQFHDFVPAAEARMRAIQERLAQSHATTYSFPFVWENWRRQAA
jgi:FkbM family methyltransferase